MNARFKFPQHSLMIDTHSSRGSNSAGGLYLGQARIIGVVICEGTVTCEDTNTLVYDAGLSANAPTGYTYVDGMNVSAGTWKQVVQ